MKDAQNKFNFFENRFPNQTFIENLRTFLFYSNWI